MALSSQSTNLNNQCPDVIWYNRSFHWSVCHVCKKKFKPSDIIRQCACHMIYYCCIDHELEDRIYHASFCSVIQSIFTQVEFKHRFCASTFNRVDWINSRNALINLIEHKLARPLYLHEKQMIMFVRSCLVCRTQENLSYCHFCCCVSYCLQHKIQATEIHRTTCFALLECFKFDTQPFRLIFGMQFGKFSNESKPLENMDEFIEQYIPKDNLSMLMRISYTDYLSGPLTLCYWIQQFDLLEPESMAGPNFTIHIIYTNVLDREYIEAWHLLLHYLPDVWNLRVELIGSVTSYESDPILFCHLCRVRCKKFTYGWYRELYHEYVSSEHYKKPNVIMGFETNLAIWKMETVTALKRRILCPIIITGQSKDELDDYIYLMNFSEEGVPFNYTFYAAIANPFGSNRPHRRIEYDDVFYRNKFVVVFKNSEDKLNISIEQALK